MTNYVVGFLFTEDFNSLLLIKKNRPDWQRGYLNGIGGKIEPAESGHMAIVREFNEETDLYINNWFKVCEMNVLENGATIYFFAAKIIIRAFFKFKQKTDEELKVVHPEYLLNFNVIPNLKWLVPFSKGVLQENYKAVNVVETFKGGIN